MASRLNDRQRAFIAAYIADPKHDAKAACQAAGYKSPAASASKMMQSPAVVAELERWRSELITAAVEHATIDRDMMIDILEQQAARLLFIQSERAKKYAGETGGASGMIVKRTRYFGSGEDVRVYEELAVDNSTNKELRETLKQLAIMRGDWTEKREVRRGTITTPIQEIVIEPSFVPLPADQEP